MHSSTTLHTLQVGLIHFVAWMQDKLEGQDAVFWPERRYPWGVSEAFNPQHSDLLHLRLLLLKEACDELSAAKRSRYGQCRTDRRTDRSCIKNLLYAAA